MNTTSKTNAAAKKTTSKTDAMRATREAKATAPTEPAPAVESAPAAPPAPASKPAAKAAPKAAPAAKTNGAAAAAPKAMPASLAKAREALAAKREADRAAAAGKSGVFVQTRTAVTKLTTRVEALQRRVARWHLVVAESDVFSPIADNLKTAAEALKGASTGFAHVPDNWKPPMGGVRTTAMRAGDIVAVRQTVRASYEDVLDADEMDGLKVETVGAKGKVVCRTKVGDRVVFPANHLAHAKEETAEAPPAAPSAPASKPAKKA